MLANLFTSFTNRPNKLERQKKRSPASILLLQSGGMSMSINEDVAVDILHHCDRTRSKEARLALDKLVWGPLQKDGLQVSRDCVLSPRRDILTAQEAAKTETNGATWKCLLCSKVFRNEHYIDKHLARKHAEVRHKGTSVCLADLCGSLIPCLPQSAKPLPPVSSALVSLTDEGQPTPLPEIKDYCKDKAQRRRRVVACTETYKECLLHTVQNVPNKILRRHTERLRWEVCERAVKVDCITRERLWEKVGSPDEFLTTGSQSGLLFLMCCFTVFILTIASICVSTRRGQFGASIIQKRRKHE